MTRKETYEIQTVKTCILSANCDKCGKEVAVLNDCISLDKHIPTIKDKSGTYAADVYSFELCKECWIDAVDILISNGYKIRKRLAIY